jgi:hypothetical protein
MIFNVANVVVPVVVSVVVPVVGCTWVCTVDTKQKLLAMEGT